jgi:hypothetical protein
MDIKKIVPPPVVQPPTKIVIELTEQEARSLYYDIDPEDGDHLAELDEKLRAAVFGDL